MTSDEKRLKKYSVTKDGPFIVYIRQKERHIDPLILQKLVFAKYSSCNKAYCVNRSKLKFEFIDVKEANDLLTDGDFGDYKVYVPADIVEVRGVVNMVTSHVDHLTKSSVGGFRNPNVEKVRILEVYEFTKPGTSDRTGQIKITFEGTVLPDHIIVDEELIVPVRPFHPRPFFCEKCLDYGHSIAYCTKLVQKCRKCGENHTLENCVSELKCFHCNGKHMAGSKECTTKRRVEQKTKEQNQIKLFNSYQLLMSKAEKEDFQDDSCSEGDDETQNELNSFGKRKRTSNKQQPKSKRNFQSYADVVSQSNPTNNFGNQPRSKSKTGQGSSRNHSSVYATVEDIIRKSKMPDIIKNLLIQLLPPLIESLWAQLTEAITLGMGQTNNVK